MSDERDDAVHILDPATSRPLCGTPLELCGTATRLYGPQPDMGGGCWTCMQKRAELVDEPSGTEATP